MKSINSKNKLLEIEKKIKKNLKFDPQNINLFFSLGSLQIQLKKIDEAKKNFKKIISLKPDFVNSYFNLAVIHYKTGEFNDSEFFFLKTIELKNNYVQAYYGLGNVQIKLGKLLEAEHNFKKAISLKPDYVDAHNNLGVVLKELKKIDEAENAYSKTLKLNPNHEMALLGRGQIYFNKGKFDLALKDFELCDNIEAKANVLSSLYVLGRIDEIYKKIEIESKSNIENLYIAAFSSFIENKEEKTTSNEFCKNPIDFLYNSNLSFHFKNSKLFINKIIKEIYNLPVSWEPSGKTTHNGFQSTFNIFENSHNGISTLKSIILKEISAYKLKFEKQNCTFINNWPIKYNFSGWHVILKKQGHQSAHIHPSGWLSGVIYLKTVPHLSKNEGAIEFSLNGVNYFHKDSPSKIFLPNDGDIIFFPSSLHHKTIPFSANEDRIIVSFDLIPK